MDPKTVLVFSPLYAPSLGGVEQYSRHLAEALAKQGYRAVVVTSNAFGLSSKEVEPSGVEVVRLPCHSLVGGRFPVPRKNAEYGALFGELMDESVAGVVINTRFYGHTLEGLRLAEALGVVPVVIDHGSAHLTFGNSLLDVAVRAYEHGITRRVKRHRAAFYGVSAASCRWLTHFGIEAQGVLSNSIDATAFRERSSGRDFRTELELPPDAFVVVFTGRFTPEKGIRPLMGAAARLLEEEDVFFLLAGDGPLAAEVSGRALPNVKPVGRLDSSDISALMACADAFCLPTRSEGFSTSLLECAAWGVAPVITCVGGVEELVPSDDYGIVLQEASSEEVASALLSLRDDRALCRKIGSNIRARVERGFSWAAAAGRTVLACAEAQTRKGAL